jgi:hypothetical protein
MKNDIFWCELNLQTLFAIIRRPSDKNGHIAAANN